MPRPHRSWCACSGKRRRPSDGPERPGTLTAEQMELEGRHPDFGVVTLGQLLATWVAHDLGHIAQIARVLAGSYAAEVGPWAAYLPITRITRT